jgi:hypothetical protein
MPDGTPVKPAFQLLQERVKPYTPGMGEGSPAFRRPPSAAWRMRWVSPRATRRSNCRSPGPTAGANATTRHRQPGGLPRHARSGGAQQRLPDHPRAGDPDVAAGHHRPPRRLPPQGALPARRAALRGHPTIRKRSSPTRRSTACAAGLAVESPDDLFVDDDGQPGAHRQGLSPGSTRCRCTA